MQIPASIAAQGYDLARNAAAPGAGSAPRPAEAALGAQVGSFTQSLQQAEAAATQSMTSGADPHSLVQALAETEMAVETAVSVRDKVVKAYLEILRMPV